MKTSFTGFLPASTGVRRPSCPYAIRFVSAAKTLWGWFVLLKQVLEGKIHSFTYPRGDNLLSNGQNNSAQAVGLLELKKCSSTSATGHSQYQTYAWWKTPWNPSSFPCFKGLALSVGTLPWSQSGANWAKSDTAAPSKTGSKSQRKHRPNPCNQIQQLCNVLSESLTGHFPRCSLGTALLAERNLNSAKPTMLVQEGLEATNTEKWYATRNHDSTCHTRISSRKKMACKTCVCSPPVPHCETLPNLHAGRVPSQHMGLDFSSQQTIHKHQVW